MGRHTPSSAYDHVIKRVSADHYRISWVVDRHYASSRLRHPTAVWRDTDESGALRFCKKHGLTFPTPTAQE